MPRCPKCATDISETFLEAPYFKETGGHPGDPAGTGGNTPVEPVAFGTQECEGCGHKFEVSG